MTIQLDSTSRLRFAPSPTGELHVGGARTALFNWLAARHAGATFILRIEDTDRERSTQESVDAILEGMAWLGLAWDEGPVFQSSRINAHLAAIDSMIDTGHAYPCFCKPEVLEAQREQARAQGGEFVYDGRCRRLGAEVAMQRLDNGEPYAIRFHVEPGRTIAFEDMVGGHRSFETDRIGDFILRRSDGTPVFHLGVVVDDHDAGVTHILRGDDHLDNTPRQILIFEALGWTPPVYGHMPMIMGPDRTRLSKRHGATSVRAFEQEGFLPQAMINFLALLGWSFDDKTELMTREELVERFSIDRINRSAAMFDRAKLLSINAHYMKTIDRAELVERAKEFMRRSGLAEKHLAEPRFCFLVTAVVERARTFQEMREQLDYFFVADIELYDAAAAQKHFLAEGAEDRLAKMEELFAEAPHFNAAALSAAMHGLVEREGAKLGQYAQLLRLALTGRTASPGIFEVLEGLGPELTLSRIYAARKWIRENPAAPRTDGAQ